MGTQAPDVFISYAREDEGWVRPLVAELERRGRSVFWDRRIPAGKDWRSHIGAALERARCVVVVWSRHSISSKFVLEEADEGKERDVLLPTFRHRVRPPLGFRGIHAADLSGWSPTEASAAFETFMADLAEVLGPAPEPGRGEIGASDQRAERPMAGEPEAALPPPLAPEVPPSRALDPEQPPGAAPKSEAPPPRAANREAVQSPEEAASSKTSPRAAGLAEITPPEPPPPPPTRGLGRPLMIAAGVLAVGGLALGLYTYGTPELERPAETFTDTLADGSPCPFCPEMVVIPAGSFTMGSQPTEEGRYDDEGPQRKVTFARPFAIGRYEVTFAEWDACVAAGDCNGYEPDDRGWGRGWRPVINVSWQDAQAYAAWLAKKTGEPYRLPTEAEWEYAARAGTATPFWTGATISTAQANYDGNYTYGAGVQGVYRERTVAVDDPAFPANPIGLYHVHGNVWEWVQNSYRDSYAGAPLDGSVAVDVAGSPGRVLRGGSWDDLPRFLRSAIRSRFAAGVRLNYVGFRVARALTP